MATTNYKTIAQRIGKAKGQILAHAVSKEVLQTSAESKNMQRNMGDTVVYRRYLPFDAATTDHNTQNRPEVNVTTIVRQYDCLYDYSDKLQVPNEDDIPEQIKIHCGERIGLLREMIAYGILRGCTNVFYKGGLSRASVNGPISMKLLHQVTRNLKSNRAEMVSAPIMTANKNNMSPVEVGWLVFCHTDLEQDLRSLSSFVTTPQYARGDPVHKEEIGSIEQFRFILSREIKPYANAGAAVGTTGLISTSGSKVDVYPILICAQSAWANVTLQGMDGVSINHIPPSVRSKSDPLGQRGYFGATFWAAPFIQNDRWMAVAHVGATSM